MKTITLLLLCLLPLYAAVSTHVFWYKATTNGYDLADNTGPNIQGPVIVHEGKIASGAIAQHSGANYPSFNFGSGVDDAQGRCAWFWSKDLCDMSGNVTSAKYRAEYRDGYSGGSFCNAGPIRIIRGVADFQGNIDFWGGADLVDDAANWKDDADLLGSFMGFNVVDANLKAMDTLNFTAVGGRQSDIDPSILDKQFVEVDCTPQVNWILQNTVAAGNPSALSGQYAVVFLVTPGLGSTGKVLAYTEEDCVRPINGSDNPWTQDGNTGHLVVISDMTCGTCPPPPSTIISLIPVGTPTLNRKPKFQWHPPLAGAASYTLQIDTTSRFTLPIVSIPLPDTFFTPLANLPMQTIYWRVGAGQPLQYSATSSFVIVDANLPVLIPVLPDPSQDKRQTFKWYNVTGATGYQIQIAHDSLFASPDVSVSVPDTSFKPLSDLKTGTIYWRAKSNQGTAYSRWSKFLLQSDTIPYLYAFNGSGTAQKRPLFRWKPVSRATGYRIQVDTVKAFATPIVSLNVSDTFFTPLANLANDVYYWRVSCDLNSALFSWTDSLVIVPADVEAKKVEAWVKAGIGVSPNPFNSALTIRFANPGRNASVVIVDMDGRVAARFEGLQGNELRWNAENQPSGVYLLRAQMGGKIYYKRICRVK